MEKQETNIREDIINYFKKKGIPGGEIDKYYIPRYSSFIQSEDTILKSKVNYSILLEQKYFGDIPTDPNILNKSQLDLISKNPSLTFTLSFKEDEFARSYVDVNFTFTNVIKYNIDKLIQLKRNLLVKNESSYREGFIVQDEYILPGQNYCSLQFRLFKENNRMFMEITSYPYTDMDKDILGVSSKIILDYRLANYVIDTLLMTIEYSTNGYIFVDDWNDLFILGKPKIITIPDNRLQFNKFLEGLNPEFRKFCEEGYESFIEQLIKNSTSYLRNPIFYVSDIKSYFLTGYGRDILNKTYVISKYNDQDTKFGSKEFIFVSNILPMERYKEINKNITNFSNKTYLTFNLGEDKNNHSLDLFLSKLNNELKKSMYDNDIYNDIIPLFLDFAKFIKEFISMKKNKSVLKYFNPKQLTNYYYTFLENKYTLYFLENNYDNSYRNKDTIVLKEEEEILGVSDTILSIYNFEGYLGTNTILENLPDYIDSISHKIEEYKDEKENLKKQSDVYEIESKIEILKRKNKQFEILLDALQKNGNKEIGLEDVIFEDLGDIIYFIRYLKTLNIEYINDGIYLSEIYEYSKTSYTYYYLYMGILKKFGSVLNSEIINSYSNYYKIIDNKLKLFYDKEEYKLKIPYREEKFITSGEDIFNKDEMLKVYKSYRTIKNAEKVKELYEKGNTYDYLKDFTYPEEREKADYYRLDNLYFEIFINNQREFLKEDMKNKKEINNFIKNYSENTFRENIKNEMIKYKNKVDNLKSRILNLINRYKDYIYDGIIYPNYLNEFVEEFKSIRENLFEIPNFFEYFKFTEKINNEFGNKFLVNIYNEINKDSIVVYEEKEVEKEVESKPDIGISLPEKSPELKKLNELMSRLNKAKTERLREIPFSPKYEQVSGKISELKSKIEEEEIKLQKEKEIKEKESKEEKIKNIKNELKKYIVSFDKIAQSPKDRNKIYDKVLYCYTSEKEKEILKQKSEKYIDNLYEETLKNLIKPKGDEYVEYFEKNIDLDKIKEKFVNFVTINQTIENYKNNELKDRKVNFDKLKKLKDKKILQEIILKINIVNTDNNTILNIYSKIVENGDTYRESEEIMDYFYDIFRKNLISIFPGLEKYIIVGKCDNILKTSFLNNIKNQIFNLYTYTYNFVLNLGNYIDKNIIKYNQDSIKNEFTDFFNKTLELKENYNIRELGMSDLFEQKNLTEYLDSNFKDILNRKLVEAAKKHGRYKGQNYSGNIEKFKNKLKNKLIDYCLEFLGINGLNISKKISIDLCNFIVENKNDYILKDNFFDNIISKIKSEKYDEIFNDINIEINNLKKSYSELFLENRSKELYNLAKKYFFLVKLLPIVEKNISNLDSELNRFVYSYTDMEGLKSKYGENIDLEYFKELIKLDPDMVENYLLAYAKDELLKLKKLMDNYEGKFKVEINSIFGKELFDKLEVYTNFDKNTNCNYVLNISAPKNFNYQLNRELSKNVKDEIFISSLQQGTQQSIKSSSKQTTSPPQRIQQSIKSSSKQTTSPPQRTQRSTESSFQQITSPPQRIQQSIKSSSKQKQAKFLPQRTQQSIKSSSKQKQTILSEQASISKPSKTTSTFSSKKSRQKEPVPTLSTTTSIPSESTSISGSSSKQVMDILISLGMKTQSEVNYS